MAGSVRRSPARRSPQSGGDRGNWGSRPLRAARDRPINAPDPRHPSALRVNVAMRLSGRRSGPQRRPVTSSTSTSIRRASSSANISRTRSMSASFSMRSASAILSSVIAALRPWLSHRNLTSTEHPAARCTRQIAPRAVGLLAGYLVRGSRRRRALVGQIAGPWCEVCAALTRRHGLHVF